jgi:hypothetical protein
MNLEEEYFKKFKATTKKKLGNEAYSKLTEKELLDTAMNLLVLVNAVYQPIRKKHYDEVEKRAEEKAY